MVFSDSRSIIYIFVKSNDKIWGILKVPGLCGRLQNRV